MSYFKVNEGSVTETVKQYIPECPGWHALIVDTINRLVYLCKLFDTDGFEICQIKEKYGSLRLYLDFFPSTDDESKNEMQLKIFRDVIDVAEWRSTQICQISGNYGRLRDVNGWDMTISDDEYSKIINKHGLRNG